MEITFAGRMDGFKSGIFIGWEMPDSQGSMFVWIPLPADYNSSVKFCFDLLDRTGLLCTPGSALETLEEKHVRFALARSVPVVSEIVASVTASRILGGGQ